MLPVFDQQDDEKSIDIVEVNVEPPIEEEKKALVILGGGVKGAYGVGVLLYLICELGERYDIITGTSVGALNGSFIAQYNKEDQNQAVNDLYNLWLKIDHLKIRKSWFPFGFVHYIWEKALYDSKPLEELVDQNLDDYKLHHSNVILSVGATSIGYGKYTEFDNKDPYIKDAVKASAAFPIFFKPVKIGNDLYVDGGVKQTAPLKKAISLGATHITVLATGPVKSDNIDENNLGIIDLPMRMIELQGDAILEDDLRDFRETNELIKTNQLLNPKRRVVEYRLITPDKRLIKNPLDFSPDKIRKMIKEGYEKAKEVMSEEVK